jgi:hypothetical protein
MPSAFRYVLGSLLCLSACRSSDIPTPGFSSQVMLQAFTSAAPAGATDSVVCSLHVGFPFGDSIPSTWSGRATVSVNRYTLRGTAGPLRDTLLYDVPIEIASHAADSLRVTIGGTAPLVLDGRVGGGNDSHSREATGRWRCDDRLPLARAVPGEATGQWFLFVVIPID